MLRASIVALGRGLALALGLALGCGPVASGRGGDDPLDAPWLGDATTITGAHLEQLAALARADPEATALFTEARERLGGSFDALAKLMTICPASVTLEGGLTIVESEDLLVGRSLQEIASVPGPRAEASVAPFAGKPHRAIRRVDSPDAVLVERTLLPRICFVQRLTLGEAYEGAVHELVHALWYEPHDLARLAATSPDEATFLRRLMVAPGGEVQAYLLSTRARLRLPGGHRVPALAGVIDLRAVASLQPEALAELILTPPPRGLGYAAGISRGAYADARGALERGIAQRRDVYGALLQDRRQNLAVAAQRVDVFTQNLEIHRHNAGIARARGDRALEAREDAALAQTQRDLTETRALAEAAGASEARIAAILAGLDPNAAATSPPLK